MQLMLLNLMNFSTFDFLKEAPYMVRSQQANRDGQTGLKTQQ